MREKKKVRQNQKNRMTKSKQHLTFCSRMKCALSIQRLTAFILLLQLNVAYAQSDSLRTFTLAEFLTIVKTYHPLAKQADIVTDKAKAELLIARGGFDPMLYSDYDRKVFYGNNYYSFFSSEIKIPGWYGIEVKAGYDYSYGSNINPSDFIPKTGLAYVGVSVPLLKGLFTDKKRADLQKAKLFVSASEQQRILMLNDLLLDAVKGYYEWTLAYRNKRIIEEALLLSQQRFAATTQATLLGDRAPIDSTEAMAQYQTRQYEFNQANLDFQKASFELSNFLWTQNEQPYLLPYGVVPEFNDAAVFAQSVKLKPLTELEQTIQTTHPNVLMYQLKVKQLEVERKLKIENLKPTLNASYNLLSKDVSTWSNPEWSMFKDYYKFGVKFSMPLTFAQGRGDVRMANLKIREAKYDLELKRNELNNKLRSYYTELVVLKEQVNLYKATVINYEKLFTGEVMRYNAGESNVFLVNTRENKWLEAQQKLAEVQLKYFKAEAALKWVMMQLN